VAKLEKLRRQLQRTFSKGKSPEMGAQCCKGDAYVNQVEAVRKGLDEKVSLCLKIVPWHSACVETWPPSHASTFYHIRDA